MGVKKTNPDNEGSLLSSNADSLLYRWNNRWTSTDKQGTFWIKKILLHTKTPEQKYQQHQIRILSINPLIQID